MPYIIADVGCDVMNKISFSAQANDLFLSFISVFSLFFMAVGLRQKQLNKTNNILPESDCFKEVNLWNPADFQKTHSWNLISFCKSLK